MPLKPDATALVLLTPDLDHLTDPWRHRFDPSCSQGVPAHITLLYPFVPPEQVEEPSLILALAALFAASAAFSYSLGPAARLSHLSYLPPSPTAPFEALTALLVRRWPMHLPYRGKYGPEVRPHLSIGYSDDGLTPSLSDHILLAAALDPHLPLQTDATEVALLKRRDDRWSAGPRFALGTAR